MSISLIYQILCFIGLISGLIVVSAMNPIHRIAYLVIVFLIGAFILTLLDYYFLGLTYIIVYVGAIAILFLFVIMMVQIPLLSNKFNNITPRIYTSTNNSMKLNSFKNNNNLKKLVLVDNFNNVNLKEEASSMEILKSLIINNNEIISLLTIDLKNISHFNSINTNLNNFNLSKNNKVETIHYTDYIIKIINNFSTMYISIAILISFYFFYHLQINNLPLNDLYNTYDIVSYFYPTWAIEYKTMTDIESLGNLIYIAYPTALILISIALWIVLIGIISLCSSSNSK